MKVGSGGVNHLEVFTPFSLRPTSVTTRCELKPPASLIALRNRLLSLFSSAAWAAVVPGGSLMGSKATRDDLQANLVPTWYQRQ